MIETVKQPYELLVRWREGKITGAHVGFELTATEDGNVLSTTPLPVMAVDIGQGVGFPLADILAQVHTDALVSRDEAIAEKTVVQTECTKHEATIAALEAKIMELEKVNAIPNPAAISIA